MQEFNVNAEHDKFDDFKTSRNQTGPRSSDRRFYRAVVLSLGLLIVFLLVRLGFGVYYRNLDRGSAAEFSVMKDNLTQCLQASDKKLSDVSEERNRLNVRLSSLTAERDQLNISLTEMTKEVNRLQKKTCPAGWHMFNFSCYFISRVSGSWKRGRQDCKDREADLVVIDSAEEQKLILGFITVDTWIGLTDSEEEGTWKWVDGSSLTLRNWNEGEPNDGASGEDCGEIIQKVHKWNDLSCNVSQQWICEKKV
ncbi:CD209 antigen-like protein C [Channa argus]|uniref:CD209 antigen-like protein C n=1 Tax=Channa argus TaxID=215402 RepID=UPI00351F9AFB